MPLIDQSLLSFTGEGSISVVSRVFPTNRADRHD